MPGKISSLTNGLALGVEKKADKGRQKHQHVCDHGCLGLVHVGAKSKASWHAKMSQVISVSCQACALACTSGSDSTGVCCMAQRHTDHSTKNRDMELQMFALFYGAQRSAGLGSRTRLELQSQLRVCPYPRVRKDIVLSVV
jgi:hypothetical protein